MIINTHIDEDHISGAISFIKENGDADKPQIIQVDEICMDGRYKCKEIVDFYEWGKT